MTMTFDTAAFDGRKFQMHLAQERQKLDLATFDEAKHPRLKGKFVKTHGDLKKVLSDLKPGDVHQLPDGTTVQKHKDTDYEIYHGKNAKQDSFDAKRPHLNHRGVRNAGASNPEMAATKALAVSAAHNDEKSVGGKKKHDHLALLFPKGNYDEKAAQSKISELFQSDADVQDLEHGRKPSDAVAAERAKPHNQVARLKKELFALPQGNDNRSDEQKARAVELRSKIRELQDGKPGSPGAESPDTPKALRGQVKALESQLRQEKDVARSRALRIKLNGLLRRLDEHADAGRK